MKRYGSFAEAIKHAKHELYHNSQIVATKTWQSTDVTKRPEMVTHEVVWWGFSVHVDQGLMISPKTTALAFEIQPNLPWADDHFEERVCGHPLNPGLQWRNWPWAQSADKFRKDEMFNHTYAERYFPKAAGMYEAHEKADQYKAMPKDSPWLNRGIRYQYGDLNDVIDQLVRDIHTRQAILPVFFPEDTGAVHGDRVPCSISYHFMVRDNRLSVFYHLRSCDFVRHFRDDIYLTLRLQLWVIDRLMERGVNLSPGIFNMFIGSLHIFRNDWRELYGEEYKR